MKIQKHKSKRVRVSMISLLFCIGLTQLFSQYSLSVTQRETLDLPPFSIFKSSKVWRLMNTSSSINAGEIDKLISKLKDNSENMKQIEVTTRSSFQLVPLLLFRARNLFSERRWTNEEIEQGRKLSEFFALLAHKPELRIEKRDQSSFREGLLRIRNWFATLCEDNQILGMMILTTDDGPFFGKEINGELVSRLIKLDSVSIPGRAADLVLMADKTQVETVIIGVVKHDGAPIWLKRFSGAPRGEIKGASLVREDIIRLEGYGYRCGLIADWTYGNEYSHIYIDESLKLRFYFISW